MNYLNGYGSKIPGAQKKGLAKVDPLNASIYTWIRGSLWIGVFCLVHCNLVCLKIKNGVEFGGKNGIFEASSYFDPVNILEWVSIETF